ncbi:hypothetical protein AB0J82_20725 [Asanoa sp. NPDC049518]|uniref:hypothetical protein n=1 Tax=unclassified Asanoa TaxID=2685164 RepID=UPI003412B858
MTVSFHDLLHRIPGVPAHTEPPPGHQGTRLSLNRRWNHTSARRARFLPAWQRRIAALFDRERR